MCRFPPVFAYPTSEPNSERIVHWGAYIETMIESWCVELQEVRRGDLSVVGGKAANLGELIHAGFDVPEGFVVTTDAFRTAVGDASSRNDIEALEISGELEEAIRQAYSELSERCVAVRSSATAEDLPGAAFAGQQDTYLDISGGDDVIAAVRDCWASLFSDRAIAYRNRLGIQPSSVAMAVVVQTMVPADTAGVMFTANPVTGARDQVVIDAAAGLGEAVVSGDVIPDHFVVDAQDGIIESTTGGAISDETRHRDAEPLALSEAQVTELAAVGRRIAGHFERPQDIEWAFHKDRLFILQSRAMTALPPPPIRLTRFQRAIGSIILELLPRRPLPMELTASIRPIVGAHVVDMIYGIAGVALDFDDVLPAQDDVVQEFVPPLPRPTLRTPWRVLRALVSGLQGSPRAWRTDPRLATYRSDVAGLGQLDLEQLSWEELVAVPRRAKLLVDVMTQFRVDHLPRSAVALAKLRLALLLSRTKVSIPEVLGQAPTMTRAANQELAALAEAASQIPELRELLLDVDQERVAELAPSLPAASQWWDQFQQFLTTYGHRETTSVLLAHDPTWGDSPGTVLGLIQVLLDQPQTGPATSSAPGVTAATLSGWQRRLARGAAEAVALREDTHFEITRVGPAVRNSIREMGRRLVEAGELGDAEDVWMLTLDEVNGWAGKPSGIGDALGAAARRRRIAYAELAASPLIATTTLYPHRAGSGSALVVGAAGGGGRATGAVRVIGGPDEFGNLRAGEVLVCVATNPSWTPLFQRAAAVVVDRGGMASHAAIVAREYGIPAVMGAATATSTLHDGQLVTVDGDAGEVTDGAEEA